MLYFLSAEESSTSLGVDLAVAGGSSADTGDTGDTGGTQTDVGIGVKPNGDLFDIASGDALPRGTGNDDFTIDDRPLESAIGPFDLFSLGGLGTGIGRVVLRGIAIGAAKKAGGIAASNGTKILGYTKHGVDRAIGDAGKRAGVKPSSILDTIKNPQSIKSGFNSKGRPFQVFTGNTSRVIVNPDTGKIVSVNPLSGAGVR